MIKRNNHSVIIRDNKDKIKQWFLDNYGVQIKIKEIPSPDPESNFQPFHLEEGGDAFMMIFEDYITYNIHESIRESLKKYLTALDRKRKINLI